MYSFPFCATISVMFFFIHFLYFFLSGRQMGSGFLCTVIADFRPTGHCLHRIVHPRVGLRGMAVREEEGGGRCAGDSPQVSGGPGAGPAAQGLPLGDGDGEGLRHGQHPGLPGLVHAHHTNLLHTDAHHKTHYLQLTHFQYNSSRVNIGSKCAYLH